MSPLQKVALKHKTWVRTVISFGCDPAIAEDIVQEAYIKINKLIEKGLDISYGNEINYFYVYKTLKTLYGDLFKASISTFFIFLFCLNKSPYKVFNVLYT